MILCVYETEGQCDCSIVDKGRMVKYTKLEKEIVGRLQRDMFGLYFKCNKKSSQDFTEGVILEENVVWKLFVLSKSLS